MSEYKIVIDLLSSTAALIAILSVLWSWVRSIRPPLSIDRVVVHQRDNDSTYIIVVKNRQAYPVEIKSTDCYTKPNYRVEKEKGESPEYSAILSLSDNIFMNKESFIIGANGHTDIRIVGQTFEALPGRLLFSLQTSHGYHQLWNKRIVVVPMSRTGTKSLRAMDLIRNYDSKVKAKLFYYWLLCKRMIGKN